MKQTGVIPGILCFSQASPQLGRKEGPGCPSWDTAGRVGAVTEATVVQGVCVGGGHPPLGWQEGDRERTKTGQTEERGILNMSMRCLAKQNV